jgi:hypothetical protein
MKVIRIDDPIYNSAIYVIPKATPKELVKYFKKKYGYQYEHDSGMGGLYLTIHSEEVGICHHYLIFMEFCNTPEGMGDFIHELLHMVFGILDRVGVKLAKESDEAFTYYADFLTEKILNKICE